MVTLICFAIKKGNHPKFIDKCEQKRYCFSTFISNWILRKAYIHFPLGFLSCFNTWLRSWESHFIYGFSQQHIIKPNFMSSDIHKFWHCKENYNLCSINKMVYSELGGFRYWGKYSGFLHFFCFSSAGRQMWRRTPLGNGCWFQHLAVLSSSVDVPDKVSFCW